MENLFALTQKDIELQDAIVEAGANKIIELKAEWIDVCIAACRFHLTMSSMIGHEIHGVRVRHNNKWSSVEFKLLPQDESDDTVFVSNEIRQPDQIEIIEAMMTAGEESENGFSYLDFLCCAARLLLIGVEHVSPEVKVLRFRHDKKNYTMNLVTE